MTPEQSETAISLKITGAERGFGSDFDAVGITLPANAGAVSIGVCPGQSHWRVVRVKLQPICCIAGPIRDIPADSEAFGITVGGHRQAREAQTALIQHDGSTPHMKRQRRRAGLS